MCCIKHRLSSYISPNNYTPKDSPQIFEESKQLFIADNDNST